MSENLFEGFLAHTRNNNDEEDFLFDHLMEVAFMAKSFAEKFNSGALAFWLGFIHDIGKVNPRFQSYLSAMEEGRSHPKIPHAIWGAAFFYELLWHRKKEDTWKEFCLPIYGHHAGLQAPDLACQKFTQFLKENRSAISLIISSWGNLRQHLASETPFFSIIDDTHREMRVRMLFSALVDADYLTTERHFEPQRISSRGQWPGLPEMWERFRMNQDALLRKAEENPTTVNLIRKEVFHSCLSAAKHKPGVFRLTVPTGGGKTRSGLGFALQHAIQNKLQRIIVALPYTSIIDQTASEYREILEEDFPCVLEHHSQVETPDEEESQEHKYLRFDWHQKIGMHP